ncbi:alpha/beta fold hydrolase [Kitasatospora sp. NPDC050543]|uniref:alpha/beta fold hydrolase n=1 Tax=Kitasatospora sp. NPDC050543 TaxID=3364054 RepID=UPI0037BA4188
MLLPTLTARKVATSRLTVNILEIEGRSGEPVVFVHGNVSSALFWQRAMLDLPERYRPIAVDLRGFGGTDPLPVDATRGLRDHSDDLTALTETLGLHRVHLVGWSMGGGVVLQQLREHPERLRSVTLVNPVSPYGFGGTHGSDGRLNHPDGAGSGGGAANAEFVRLLAAGERGEESPLSPRTVLTSCYVKPPLESELLDVYLAGMLSTRVGDDHYPGDSRSTDAWPGTAPGDRGVLNSLAPTHFRIDDLELADPKPPVLWLRGSHDVIVSDTSLFDLAHLGALGVVPGWPGEQECPAQPMVAQTRAVLGRYAAAGGAVREVVLDAGHSVHIERPEEFAAELVALLHGCW